MGYEFFTMQGTSDFVARHAMEGTSTKPDGGALLTISQALCGLMGGLVNSLEEFHNVGKALESVNCSLDEPETSTSVDHVRIVASALKEMVGKLVSDMKASIKGDAEVHKLLPIMQKCSRANHHVFFPKHNGFQSTFLFS